MRIRYSQTEQNKGGERERAAFTDAEIQPFHRQRACAARVLNIPQPFPSLALLALFQVPLGYIPKEKERGGIFYPPGRVRGQWKRGPIGFRQGMKLPNSYVILVPHAGRWNLRVEVKG